MNSSPSQTCETVPSRRVSNNVFFTPSQQRMFRGPVLAQLQYFHPPPPTPSFILIRQLSSSGCYRVDGIRTCFVFFMKKTLSRDIRLNICQYIHLYCMYTLLLPIRAQQLFYNFNRARVVCFRFKLKD
jgi:hypothetical protein